MSSIQTGLTTTNAPKCVWSAGFTVPTRWTTPVGAFSGAARERGTSAPRALDVPAF